MAVAHYLEALDFQKEMVKIHTIYGGKNPHPNWLVGGVPCAINIDGTGAVGAINMERLNLVSSIIDQMVTFTEQVYLPDLQAIASFYKDWTVRRRAVGQIGDELRRHPGARQRLFGGVAEAAARRHHQRQSRRGAADRSRRSRAGAGVRHPFLVQISRRDQGPASVGRRHRAELRARPEVQGHQDPDRGARRGGEILLDQVAALEAATPSRSARWRATSSATPRTSRSSRSRPRSC